MKIILLFFYFIYGNSEYSDYVAKPQIFDSKFLQNNPDLSFDEFEEKWPNLKKRYGWYGMGHGPKEDFRVYQQGVPFEDDFSENLRINFFII